MEIDNKKKVLNTNEAVCELIKNKLSNCESAASLLDSVLFNRIV